MIRYWGRIAGYMARWEIWTFPPCWIADKAEPPEEPRSPLARNHVQADVIPVAVPETFAVCPPLIRTCHVVVVKVAVTWNHVSFRRSVVL